MKLKLLYNFLKKYGFNEELVMLKSAYPIIEDGIMSLDSSEGVSINNRGEGLGYERKSVDEWYSAVSFIKDDMVLVSYDKSKMGPDFYKKVFSAFNKNVEIDETHDYTYEDISEFITDSHNNFAFNSEFLNLFPSVKEAVMSAISKKFPDMSSEDVETYANEEITIILLQQEKQGTFFKNPYYLGHDLGHEFMDYEDVSTLHMELKYMIYQLGKLYVVDYTTSDEPEDLAAVGNLNLTDYVQEYYDEGMSINGLRDPEHFLMINMFKTKNENIDDKYPDIFANFAKGDFSYELFDTLALQYYRFSLSPDKKSQAEEIVNSFIEKQKIALGGDPENPDAPTIMSELHGKTIMM